jgi:hypothetical protein
VALRYCSDNGYHTSLRYKLGTGTSAFLPKKGEGYFVEENPPRTVSHLENISRCVEKGEHPSREQTYRKNFGNLKDRPEWLLGAQKGRRKVKSYEGMGTLYISC